MSLSTFDPDPIIILGAGLSGLAAQQRLNAQGITATVYEKNNDIGGHATTHHRDGFYFDEGPHISFTQNETIQTLLAKGIQNHYFAYDAKVGNYWQTHWIAHPVQCNLYGLPETLIQGSIDDMVAAESLPPLTPQSTYADWCYKTLGKTFSDTFTFAYTRKYWTLEAFDMTSDWVGNRVYSPRLEDVLQGAKSSQPNHQYHYITKFRYPQTGGFGAYVQAVSTNMHSVMLNHTLNSIDVVKKKLVFENGAKAHYSHLISSLPIPELIKRIVDCPDTVKAAAQQLSCSSVLLVNIALDCVKAFPDYQWLYVYDEDILASRIHFPHRLSPNNAPPGCSSIQVEIYYSRFKPLPDENIQARTITDLQRMGLLDAHDPIRFVAVQEILYANIIFDHNRTEALQIVQDYLAAHEIVGCGRYGEWDYFWSDDSILSGWRAADQILITLPHVKD